MNGGILMEINCEVALRVVELNRQLRLCRITADLRGWIINKDIEIQLLGYCMNEEISTNRVLDTYIEKHNELININK